MSGEIKRTGPPTARDMKGRLVDVPTWITFIDKWTAAAKTRHAQLQASQAPKKAEGPRDRERRLGELNDKFKNF